MDAGKVNPQGEKNDVVFLLNDIKICLQNAEEDIFKKQDILTTFTFTIEGFQESHHRLMQENKTLTKIKAQVPRKLKQDSTCTLSGKQEEIATSVNSYLLGVDLKPATSIRSCAKGKVLEF